jgi:beta-lactamase superfamily II metal-dependent hydrolase
MKILSFIFFMLITFMIGAGCLGSSSSEKPVPYPAQYNPDGTMTVHYIDVGEGDSELIESPGGMIMLIDAGPPESGAKVVRYLMDQGISSIDTLVISNPHNDHIGGASAVIDGFSVKEVVDGRFENYSEAYNRLTALISQKNISIRGVKEGDTIPFDPQVSVQVLNPPENRSREINQNSVVLKMTFNNKSFLFTSDAGGEAEMRYARAAGHIDVLKVADHGNENSSSSEFLSMVKPAASIIEAGAGNLFGHPSELTLNRLHQSGSVIYITKNLGSIKVISGGVYTLHVNAEKMSSETPDRKYRY